jgi:beta-fructofuranosidase
MAVPADPTDPLLRKWIKVQQNPIATHPANVGREDFRDPSTAWQQSDGSWVFTVGAVVEDRTGVALQYRSTDLQHWELEEELLHKLQGTGMWECVDFFPVDYDNNTVVSDHAITSAEKTTKSIEQKYVFKTSLIENGHDYYVIGTYDKDARKFVPDHPELDIGSGFRYDYGKFYASKTQYDPVKNRHVVWAWICESDSQAMDIAKGWSSVLVCTSLSFSLSCPCFIDYKLGVLRVDFVALGKWFLDQEFQIPEISN